MRDIWRNSSTAYRNNTNLTIFEMAKSDSGVVRWFRLHSRKTSDRSLSHTFPIKSTKMGVELEAER
jgi:hypothetical protein